MPSVVSYSAFRQARTAAAARTALGLGTSATLDVGTGASEIVQLDGSSRLPAVDGSQLTNLAGANPFDQSLDTTDSPTFAGVKTSLIECGTELIAKNDTANADFSLILEMYTSTGYRDSVLQFRRSKSATDGVLSTTADTDDFGSIYGLGVDTANAWQVGCGLVMEQDGAAGAGYVPGLLNFYTSETGTFTSRMSIGANGTCVFGATRSYAATAQISTITTLIPLVLQKSGEQANFVQCYDTGSRTNSYMFNSQMTATGLSGLIIQNAGAGDLLFHARALNAASDMYVRFDLNGSDQWIIGRQASTNDFVIAADNDDLGTAQRFVVGSTGMVNFPVDHADTPTNNDPTTDAPTDWLTIEMAGTEYQIPLYQ